ncbi:MAG: hypothetical protein R3B49_11020 [Phycisphaerales bacterium]
MNRAISVMLLAGVTTGVYAQAFTIHITADLTVVNAGDISNWTVSVTGAFGAIDYVQGYDFNLVASEVGAGLAGPFQDHLDPLLNPSPGTPSGASLLGASGGQSSILGFPVFGPIVLGTFAVTWDPTFASLTYSLEDGGVLGQTNILQIKPGSDFAADTFNGMPNVVSDTVRYIPAPASALLFAPVALFARRRR